MALRIGATTGLAALIGAMVAGLLHDGGFQDILGNALAVFWGGFLVGWLVFGKLGEALFAGMTKEEPPPEPTPAPTPPKQEKGTP